MEDRTTGWDREEVRKLDGWEDRGREGITSPTRPSWVAGRRPPNSVHRTAGELVMAEEAGMRARRVEEKLGDPEARRTNQSG